MAEVKFYPGWVDCYDCKTTIVTSTDECILIQAVDRPCPRCGSNMVGWVRPQRYCECDRCGAEVDLTHFTNTCDCGADYNSSGWLLADRSQWGEETGESLADILSID